MGGPSGGGSGGGTTTTTNNNEMLKWAEYVPPETYNAYRRTLPTLESKANTGLTPDEKAYYTGQGLVDVGKSLAGAQTSLGENLARSGARGGAVTEAYSDLARSGVQGKASMLSNIQGLDISQKQVNTENLLRALGLPGTPVSTGSTSVASYNPSKTSGGS